MNGGDLRDTRSTELVEDIVKMERTWESGGLVEKTRLSGSLDGEDTRGMRSAELAKVRGGRSDSFRKSKRIRTSGSVVTGASEPIGSRLHRLGC